MSIYIPGTNRMTSYVPGTNRLSIYVPGTNCMSGVLKTVPADDDDVLPVQQPGRRRPLLHLRTMESFGGRCPSFFLVQIVGLSMFLLQIVCPSMFLVQIA